MRKKEKVGCVQEWGQDQPSSQRICTGHQIIDALRISQGCPKKQPITNTNGKCAYLEKKIYKELAHVIYGGWEVPRNTAGKLDIKDNGPSLKVAKIDVAAQNSKAGQCHGSLG